jgi:hypothetical protein
MTVKKLVFAIAHSLIALSLLACPLAVAQSGTACQPGTAAVCPPLPAADIDGIWAIQSASAQQLRDASYFSIRAAQGGLLVIIRLGSSDWQAYVTTLLGNSATVVTITTQAINSWRIDFVSAQQATITGLTCILNGSGGGPVPLGASPTVGSTDPASTPDVVGAPIYLGNRCFVPQGAMLALSKVL